MYLFTVLLFFSFIAICRFSYTVLFSINAKFWNKYPIFDFKSKVAFFENGLIPFSPNKMISPESGLSNKPIIFNNVDLPHPDFPIIATNSFSYMVQENESKITFSLNFF